MSETDSEEFDKLKFAFYLKLLDERHKECLELVLYFLVFIFVLFVLNDERIISCIQSNGESRILIDFFFGSFFLDLFEFILPHKELFLDEGFKFFFSFFDGNKLIKDGYSVSFHIIDIKVLFSIIRVDGIDFEEVLLSIG